MQHHVETATGGDTLVAAPPSVTSPVNGALTGGFIRRLAKNLAVQDIMISVYFALMMGAVLSARGPGRDESIRTVLIDIACLTLGLVLTRGGILRHETFANGLVYRLTVSLTVFLSYFQLRWILPAVSPHSLDAELLAFDLRVFGYEPAIAWDRYVTPHATEWFSFFYFGYFWLLIVHVLPIMLVQKNQFRTAHFALGIFMVFCTGHLLYMLVPGWGPYHSLAQQFDHPLEGWLFWRLVKTTVEAGGAQKDIFPSLHTATPTFFAIYAYMHRRALPFRFTWPIMAFVAAQIVIATMFLRWHYLIDIVAGLALATTAALLSYWIVRWETARRERQGLPAIFTLLDWHGISARGGGGDAGGPGGPARREGHANPA